MFMPKLVDQGKTLELHDRLEVSPMRADYIRLTSQGWRFYAVDQSRGYCTDAIRKVITIPLFALKTLKLGYFDWYCSHEMAHAFAGLKAKHGAIFMRELIRICPIDSQHWESGYKSRNAICAGISFDGLAEDF